ncbi:MAG: TolC family protein [Longimicrobiales bacterium]
MHDSLSQSLRSWWKHGCCRAVAIVLVIAAPPDAHAQDFVTMADPRLLRALQSVVLQTSPDLAAQRALVRAAEGRASAAGFAPAAVLSAEMEDVPGGLDVASGGFRVEIGREFLTGSRSNAERALAAPEVRSANVVLLGTEQRIAVRTMDYLAQVTSASLRAARLAAEDTLLVAAESAVQDRFAVGSASYVDVLRLRTERLRVQVERAQALADERVGLELLLGLAGDDNASTVRALVDSAVVSSSSRAGDVVLPAAPAIDSLLGTSAQLRLAESAIDRALAARELLVSEQRTRFAGSLGAQRMESAGGGSTFGPVLGFSMTLPFTARRANRSATDAADLEIAAARASQASTLAHVRSQLAAAHAEYEAARERLAVFDVALLIGAQAEREGALAAFGSGDMSLVELLDFERALSRAEIDRLRSHADAATAYADLISAANGESVNPREDTQ